MSQSSSLHVAIVMDGNGRWARRRGLPRVAGHRAGAEARLGRSSDCASRWAIEAGVLLPGVDLRVRTGGERRLSDCLLWECAYAELYCTPTMWPDFGAAPLAAAVAEFRARERRFGGLPEAAAG